MYIPILAEVTDDSLWQALLALCGFLGAFFWWYVKDNRSQRVEERKQDKEFMSLEREKLKTQMDQNNKIGNLSDVLRDHVRDENEHSKDMKQSIDSMCTSNTKLSDSITRLVEQNNEVRMVG